MKYIIPTYEHDDNFKRKKSYLSSSSSTSLILNIILFVFSCIFILCLLNVIHHKKQIIVTERNIDITTAVINTLMDENNIIRKTSYYDYEPYLKNISLQPTNKTRQFHYIDLGCFDGRDIDYFVHFHMQEIARVGELNVIAFEPDPINFSACKSKQKLPKSITKTVYDAAVWTKNDKVQYATERGQKSRIDDNSALYVDSIDFSRWLLDNFREEEYLYVKFTVEGAEIPILEKMINDGSLLLVDYLEVEWNNISPDFEARRVSLECMFDSFGMDFIQMVNPVDLKHAYNANETFSSVPKDKTWKLSNSLIRFHYKTRKDVPILLAERLKRKQQQQLSA